jgi:hypothetical protein
VIKLEKTYEAESPPRPTTLQDLMSTRPLHAEVDTDTDIKPDINGHGDRHRDKDKDKARVEAAGVKPTYGFEGCPSFPPKWTYATPDIVRTLWLTSREWAKLIIRTMWWMIHPMDRLRNGRWTLLN